MTDLTSCMTDVLEQMGNRDNRKANDYKQNGILYCGKCHTPKQTKQDGPFGKGSKLFTITCQCKQEENERDRARKDKQNFEAQMSSLREQYGVSDRTFEKYTFELDDQKNSGISSTCRLYVDRWEEMKADNMGIIFYGSVGTGKSFYASCIVNALLDYGVPAAVTSFPRLLNILQSTKDRQAVIDHLQAYHLLVIDDMGVERDSSYANEQVFNIIDARVRSGLPLIVTTNLTKEELEKAPTMQLARIYDRVLEACPIWFKMVGESRRTANAKQRKEKARELLRAGGIN